MRLLELFLALSAIMSSVNAISAPTSTPAPESSSPPVDTGGSNLNSTLTTNSIESAWVLYTGSALNGFQNVIFTKQASDPSNKCHLTGYYDPKQRNATTAVSCFLDLQALVVYSFQQGLRIYYTGVMYLAGADGPEDDCAVICKSFNGTSAVAPLLGGSLAGYGSWSYILMLFTALVLVTECFYESWT